MFKGALIYMVILVAVSGAMAAAPAGLSAPSATKPVVKPPDTAIIASPGGLVLAPSRDGLPQGWYKAEGANCYLIYSNYGIYGGIGFVDIDEYGFHYNLDVSTDPEHYYGGYSWTDSPSLFDYEVCVHTATCTPDPISLPAGASNIVVEYAAKWDIEENYDGCELVYSTEVPTDDNPEIWQNLQATSTVLGSGYPESGQSDPTRYYYENHDGYNNEWIPGETADISFLAGQDVYIGFVFRSDNSNPDPHDGIYIDGFQVVADGNVEYENGFESDDPDDEPWDMFRYTSYGSEDWYYSEAMSLEINFLRAGEFVVGNSAGYIADPYEDPISDWGVERTYTQGGHFVVVFSNSATVRIGDPEFEISAHVYPQSEYVVLDCYVKSLRQGTTNNIYAGVLMWLQIKHFHYETYNDDVVTYDAAHDMAIYKDLNGENDPVVGLAYLTPDMDSSSVNFKKVIDMSDDSEIFNLISNGEHDFDGVDSEEYYWAVLVGEGPHSLTRCQTFRYTFALIGGNHMENLLENYEAARQFAEYAIEDQTPVNIKESSLGVIKSMFR
jgi:hypothetical protein